MRTTNIGAAASKLQHDVKTLRAKWDIATQEWDDPVSRDFEARQLRALEQAAEQALRGIDELQSFLSRMIKDVGPRE